WNLYALIVARFFLALGGCAGMVASKAIVRDLFKKNQVADVLSTLMLIMGVAPIIAPTVGGIVVAAFNWQAVFYILAAFAILMLFNVTYILPESAEPNHKTSLRPKAIIKEYISILRNREFFIFATARGFALGALLAYVSSAPFLFSHYFGLDEQQFGWVFGGNAFGLILGSQINRVVLKHFSLFNITMATSIMLTILTLAGLAFTFVAPVFWVIYPILFFMLFFTGFQNPNVTALALDPFTIQAGSASALIGSMSMLFGSIFSVLISTFLTDTIVPLFYILAACSICSLVLILVYYRKNQFVPARA
ncbi:hypothetical protein LCGC14_2740740, partial [marine sediment metagenome]